MGETTAIEWTDHTFNPWWGCTRVSAACDHCYAETLAHRLGMDLWGKGSERRMFGDKHWSEPLKWNAKAAKAGTPARVFCASMADVFEAGAGPDVSAARTRLFELIEVTPWLTWLLLTKRPENARLMCAMWGDDWPANVWLGTTVENQRYANIRIPHLLRNGAKTRFLSCEPLLGPVELGIGDHRDGIDWIIAGGESGHGARPMNPSWVRSLRDECAQAGVPFLFKQWGEHGADGKRVGKKAAGRALDGRTHDDYPILSALTDTTNQAR